MASCCGALQGCARFWHPWASVLTMEPPAAAPRWIAFVVKLRKMNTGSTLSQCRALDRKRGSKVRPPPCALTPWTAHHREASGASLTCDLYGPGSPSPPWEPPHAHLDPKRVAGLGRCATGQGPHGGCTELLQRLPAAAPSSARSAGQRPVCRDQKRRAGSSHAPDTCTTQLSFLVVGPRPGRMPRSV